MRKRGNLTRMTRSEPILSCIMPTFRVCHDKDDGHDLFLDYYKNGLPPAEPYNQVKKRIIIIGAGMSGLAAGKLLKDAGHDVILLEALDRAGGRLRTYR